MGQSSWYFTVHYCPSITDMIQYRFYWYNTVLGGPILVLLMIRSTIAMDQSYWYDTIPNYHNISPTDILQPTTTTAPVLFIAFNPLLPQYQAYWYDSVHNCPRTTPTYTLQYTFAQIPVLLLRYNPQLPQYPSYWYPTVHYCPSASPIDTTQYTSAYYQSLLAIDMSQSTAGPVPVLLIPDSPLLP